MSVCKHNLCKRWVVTALSAFILTILINACAPVLAAPPGSPFNYLDEEDKVRVVKILQDVSKRSSQPTRETHREFWVIWEKYKRWPESDIEDLRDWLVGPSLIYMTYVWQDAMDSLKTRTPQKSSARAKYEKRILALGVLKVSDIEKNDEMIEKVAYRQPLTTEDGQEYVVEEAGIALVMTSLMDADKRVDRLFNKVYIEAPQQ